MTSYETIPIAPPGIGEVIASPTAYAEAMTAGLTLRSFPSSGARHAARRPDGVRRRVAVLAAVVAAAGLSVGGCAGGARASLRPVWDGRHPHVWVGQDPMCAARYDGRHGWARADRSGPRFRVVCAAMGGGEFTWDAVAGGAR